MDSKILGIGLLIVSILFLILFIFNLVKGLARFGRLQTGSKVLAIFLAVFSLTGIVSTGYFSYKNLTYKPVEQNQATKELENTINEAKEIKNEQSTYKQEVGLDVLKTESVEKLFNMYSEKGKADILSWSNGSEKNKEFLLRNIGRTIDKNNTFETETLKDIRGRTIHIGNNTNKILFFGDNTEFTEKQFSNLLKYNDKSTDVDKIDFVLIFPTLKGTEVDEFLNKSKSSDLKEASNVYIITNDSMPSQVNFSLKGLAVDYFSVSNLPSFASVDKNNTISNAGVGVLLETENDVNSYINKSFKDKYKLYNEIKNPIKTKNNKVVN